MGARKRAPIWAGGGEVVLLGSEEEGEGDGERRRRRMTAGMEVESSEKKALEVRRAKARATHAVPAPRPSSQPSISTESAPPPSDRRGSDPDIPLGRGASGLCGREKLRSLG